jgi:hypothetical protein
MFRHVVMFRWQAESTAEQRAAAVAALHGFAAAVADLGVVSVGADAGLAAANFDVVVIAEFADQDGYLAYTIDPRHQELVTTYIAPILGTRAAVQSSFRRAS